MPTGSALWPPNLGTQLTLVACSIVALAILPWFVPVSDMQAHNVLHHLNFIPLMLAGMLAGWRGAVAATVFALVAQSPHLIHISSFSPLDASDQVVELSIFGAAGLVAGFLADRERHQRQKAEASSQQLAVVYGELQKNVEQLKKAERLYAAGQLSASLAHEIRNPLISISGAAGILKRGNASGENVRECLEIIDKESRRLSKLLTSFLDFARPRAPRFQPTDLVSVIQSVISLAAHATDLNRVVLLETVGEEIPEVHCDPEQIKQVLLNLVINAVQASSPGGVVSLSAAADADHISIAVQDEGYGVSASDQDHIFDPFFTTKEGGTGLGLAIASMIVSQHDGFLTVEKNRGPGMTFRLQLPRTPRPRA